MEWSEEDRCFVGIAPVCSCIQVPVFFLIITATMIPASRVRAIPVRPKVAETKIEIARTPSDKAHLANCISREPTSLVKDDSSEVASLTKVFWGEMKK